jgi:hypothetical protein
LRTDNKRLRERVSISRSYLQANILCFSTVQLDDCQTRLTTLENDITKIKPFLLLKPFSYFTDRPSIAEIKYASKFLQAIPYPSLAARNSKSRRRHKDQHEDGVRPADKTSAKPTSPQLAPPDSAETVDALTASNPFDSSARNKAANSRPVTPLSPTVPASPTTQGSPATAHYAHILASTLNKASARIIAPPSSTSNPLQPSSPLRLPSPRKSRSKRSSANIPVSWDARAEHLLLAARKKGRENALLMAGALRKVEGEMEEEKGRQEKEQITVAPTHYRAESVMFQTPGAPIHHKHPPNTQSYSPSSSPSQDRPATSAITTRPNPAATLKPLVHPSPVSNPQSSTPIPTVYSGPYPYPIPGMALPMSFIYGAPTSHTTLPASYISLLTPPHLPHTHSTIPASASSPPLRPPIAASTSQPSSSPPNNSQASTSHSLHSLADAAAARAMQVTREESVESSSGTGSSATSPNADAEESEIPRNKKRRASAVVDSSAKRRKPSGGGRGGKRTKSALELLADEAALASGRSRTSSSGTGRESSRGKGKAKDTSPLPQHAATGSSAFRVMRLGKDATGSKLKSKVVPTVPTKEGGLMPGRKRKPFGRSEDGGMTIISMNPDEEASVAGTSGLGGRLLWSDEESHTRTSSWRDLTSGTEHERAADDGADREEDTSSESEEAEETISAKPPRLGRKPIPTAAFSTVRIIEYPQDRHGSSGGPAASASDGDEGEGGEETNVTA